jgi:hypothetical protein
MAPDELLPSYGWACLVNNKLFLKLREAQASVYFGILIYF